MHINVKPRSLAFILALKFFKSFRNGLLNTSKICLSKCTSMFSNLDISCHLEGFVNGFTLLTPFDFSLIFLLKNKSS